MRYREAIIVVRVLFFILAAALSYVQIVRGNYYFNLSKRNIIRVVSIEAARGKIVDRNGIVLADTAPTYVASIIPQETGDKDALFALLSKLLDIPADTIKRSYQKNYLNPFSPVRIFEQLDKERLIALEENKLDLPGVIIEVMPKRIYPFGQMAAHVLGYLGRIDSAQVSRLKPYGYQMSDSIGQGGLEAYYDLFLRGQKGGEQIEVDNRGRKVRMVGYKPPKQGTDITLSLDARIQKIVDTCMNGQQGAAVIMDSSSGGIMAMTSQPSYDPETFVASDRSAIAALLTDSEAPLLNRVIGGQYSPGSVFKIVTSTAALDKNPQFANKQFTCNGRFEVGNRSFHCLSVHGQEDLHDALVHSCNVYFYNLGLLVGPEAMAHSAHRLGLGKKTGIDVRYEAKGIIPSPQWKNIIRLSKWYKGDTANMAIGQGDVLVTPLQVTRMIAAFANGGKLVRPYLVEAIGQKHIAFKREETGALSDEIRNTMNFFLKDVVDSPEGSAHVVKIEGLTIVGKTGTTQISGKAPHGWFVGYVRSQKATYAFCIFLEHGGSSYNACVVARSVFEQMMQEELL